MYIGFIFKMHIENVKVDWGPEKNNIDVMSSNFMYRIIQWILLLWVLVKLSWFSVGANIDLLVGYNVCSDHSDTKSFYHYNKNSAWQTQNTKFHERKEHYVSWFFWNIPTIMKHNLYFDLLIFEINYWKWYFLLTFSTDVLYSIVNQTSDSNLILLTFRRDLQ